MLKNMSSREKTLGLCVAGMLVVGGLFVGFNSWMGMYSARRQTKINLMDQKASMEDNATRFKRAHQRRKVFQSMSLKPNVAEGRTEYGDWLQSEAKKIFGRNVNLTKTSPIDKTLGKDQIIYTECGYEITPMGDLSQLTKFLHNFYATNYLHRIDNFVDVFLVGTKLLVAGFRA